mgnify:CR=1 FL=1
MGLQCFEATFCNSCILLAALLLSRSLSYAKIVQGERNKACFQLLSRSLSYAKIVQGERTTK